MKILTTGTAGFIGSAFVRQVINKAANRDRPRQSSEPPRRWHRSHPIECDSYAVVRLRGLSLIVVDKLTYAGDLRRLDSAKGKYKFYKTDICDSSQIEPLFRREKPDVVVNFAAETHVDRSIKDAGAFIQTNIKGTHVLLDAARKYNIKRFIQISTDEVHGEIRKGSFAEGAPLQPNSPYAASKAAADLLLKSYIRTYKFPAIIVRPCNNYGPWQYPEKLIPLAVLKILRGEKIPVYARGENVREWLFVEDCAEGILQIMEKGRAGEIYNLGSGQEKRNIDVVKAILSCLEKDESMIEFVKDRPGHDLRYKLNSDKVTRETGWQPKVKFEEGIEKTVNWCIEHKDWLLSKWQKIAPLYK